MASQLYLDSTTQQAMDELVSAGMFESREQVLSEGVRLVRRREGFDAGVDAEPLDPSTIAAIERGIEDMEQGRSRPAKDVFDDLRRRYAPT